MIEANVILGKLDLSVPRNLGLLQKHAVELIKSLVNSLLLDGDHGLRFHALLVFARRCPATAAWRVFGPLWSAPFAWLTLVEIIIHIVYKTTIINIGSESQLTKILRICDIHSTHNDEKYGLGYRGSAIPKMVVFENCFFPL